MCMEKDKMVFEGISCSIWKKFFQPEFFLETLREREREELKLEIDFESHTELAFSYIRQS